MKSIKNIIDTTTGCSLDQDIFSGSNNSYTTRHYVLYKKADARNLYYSMNWTQINYVDRVCTAFIIREETPLIELGKKKEEEHYNKRLIASITHDLRTPLNGIMGISDALENYLLPEGKHFLGIIKNTGMLMLYLINDVLDMEQIEAKKLRLRKVMHSPREGVEETVQLMKFNFSQKNVGLRLWYARNVPTEIYSDKTRYRQILLNLLGNALKFTSKGSVSIAMYYDQKSDMLITKVTDTGPGISSEDIPKLFQLFSRCANTESMNPSGVGLGLHICRSLSKQLSGDIFVESELGQGASFTFYISCGLVVTDDSTRLVPDESYIKKVSSSILPSCGEEYKQESMPSVSTNVSLPLFTRKLSAPYDTCPCPKVLLVDDSQMNLFVLSNYLSNSNIKSNIAYNGKEAIESVLLKAKGKCCRGYKIIYMDINMPIMDGYEATITLNNMMEHGNIPMVPIIALSAGASSEYKSGDVFKEVLDKPITKEKFLNSVLKYCTP